MLVAGHWVFLLILRALPHVPGHDGVRLFLPAFGMLAIAAGLGPRVGWRAGSAAGARRSSAAAAEAMRRRGADDAGPAVVLQPGRRRPARGDAARDGADLLLGRPDRPEVLDWLDAHTPPGRRVAVEHLPDLLRLPQSIRPAPDADLDPRAPGDRLVRRPEPAGDHEPAGPMRWSDRASRPCVVTASSASRCCGSSRISSQVPRAGSSPGRAREPRPMTDRRRRPPVPELGRHRSSSPSPRWPRPCRRPAISA